MRSRHGSFKSWAAVIYKPHMHKLKYLFIDARGIEHAMSKPDGTFASDSEVWSVTGCVKLPALAVVVAVEYRTQSARLSIA